MLVTHLPQCLGLPGPRPVGPERRREARAPGQVPLALPLQLPGCPQPLGPELGEGGEHAVAHRAVRSLRRHDDRLVDQGTDQVEEPVGGDVVVRTDRGGRGQVAPAGEDRQARPQELLLLGAEVVAPLDARPQGTVPVGQVAVPLAQEPVAVGQLPEHRLRREAAGPCGGELERQRDPLQAGTQLRDRLGVGLGDREVGARECRAVDEQLHRLELRQRLGGDPGPGHAQGRHQHDGLTGDAQPLAAGRQHAQPRAVRPQPQHQCGRCIEDVLAAVQDEQRLPVGHEAGHELRDAVRRRRRGIGMQPQRLGHGRGHEGTVRDRAEVDEPGTVGVAPPIPLQDRHRDPGLADPTRSGQRDRTVVREALTDLRQQRPPADERREDGRALDVSRLAVGDHGGRRGEGGAPTRWQTRADLSYGRNCSDTTCAAATELSCGRNCSLTTAATAHRPVIRPQLQPYDSAREGRRGRPRRRGPSPSLPGSPRPVPSRRPARRRTRPREPRRSCPGPRRRSRP